MRGERPPIAVVGVDLLGRRAWGLSWGRRLLRIVKPQHKGEIPRPRALSGGGQVKDIAALVGHHRHVGRAAIIDRLDEQQSGGAIWRHLPRKRITDGDTVYSLTGTELDHGLVVDVAGKRDNRIGVVSHRTYARVSALRKRGSRRQRKKCCCGESRKC